MEAHFQTLVLQRVPETVRNFDVAKMSNKPNLEGYIFLRVKETTTGVLVEDETGDGR